MENRKGDAAMINLYCYRCGDNAKAMEVDNSKVVNENNDVNIPVDFSCGCLKAEFDRGYEEGWKDNERQ